MALPTTLKIRLVENLYRVTDKATATLPQSTQSALFTITGGRIEVCSIVGEVTTVIQSQLNNMRLIANPTTGGDVNVCGILDINADVVGTLYGITGKFTDPLVGVEAGATEAPHGDIILTTGTLDLDCSASSTGNVKWSIRWRPLDTGAALVAA